MYILNYKTYDGAAVMISLFVSKYANIYFIEKNSTSYKIFVTRVNTIFVLSSQTRMLTYSNDTSIIKTLAALR
jgi:hypothetical protein